MRLVTQPCVRCDREVAHRITTQRQAPTPMRHKDDTSSWCSGRPKGVYELISDVLDSTAAQREVLSGVVDAYIEFGERLLRASEEHTQRQARTSVLVQKLTAALVEQTDEIRKQK